MQLSRKKKTFIAVAAVAALSGGSALAYWTQGGTGSGSATTGTTTPITVNQTNAAITNLYPGGTPVALSGDFTNGNSSAVTISSVTAVVRSFSAQTNSSKPACTAADYAIGGSAAGSPVPVGTNVGTWSGLTVALSNGAGNQDNCKGVVINIDYTANA